MIEQGGYAGQRLHEFAFLVASQAVAAPQRDHQQHEVGELIAECLRRSHTDLRAGLDHQAQVRFPRQCAVRYVTQAQAGQIVGGIGVAQCRQRIGGFTGLGNGHQ